MLAPGRSVGTEGPSPRLGGCDEQDGEIQVGCKVLSWDPLDNGGAVFEGGKSGEGVETSWGEDMVEWRIPGC